MAEVYFKPEITPENVSEVVQMAISGREGWERLLTLLVLDDAGMAAFAPTDADADGLVDDGFFYCQFFPKLGQLMHRAYIRARKWQACRVDMMAHMEGGGHDDV